MTKVNNKNILVAIAVLLGLVATVLFVFMGQVWFNRELSDATYTGLQITFGAKDGDTQVLVFSIFALLTLLALLGGTVLSLLNLLKPNKLFALISTLLLLAGGILVFLMPQFLVFENSIIGAIVEGSSNPSLTTGAVITGVLAVLGALVSGSQLVEM